jgi:TonB family protein
MSIRACIATALALGSIGSPASAEPLQPTGKWIVNFDDAQCVAQRDYGPPGKPLYLVLKQPPLGDVMQVAVVEKASDVTAEQFEGVMQFEPGPSKKISVLRFSPKNTRTRVAITNVPSVDFDGAKQAQAVRISAGPLNESFVLSDVTPLLEVMRSCVADLRAVWNVKDAEGRPPEVRDDATGNIAGLFSSDDYPSAAVRNTQGGTVKVALLVDEQGKVADCSVVETSGVAVLDAQSCAILKARAKFAPAVGPDRKPTKDAFIQKITWRI